MSTGVTTKWTNQSVTNALKWTNQSVTNALKWTNQSVTNTLLWNKEDFRTLYNLITEDSNQIVTEAGDSIVVYVSTTA